MTLAQGRVHANFQNRFYQKLLWQIFAVILILVPPDISFDCDTPWQSFCCSTFDFVAVLLIVILPESQLNVIIIGSSLIVALPGSPFN